MSDDKNEATFTFSGKLSETPVVYGVFKTNEDGTIAWARRADDLPANLSPKLRRLCDKLVETMKRNK